MGLFAEDLSKSMLLAVWDLLFQTELEVLMYVIIAIFLRLEEDILRLEEDEINHLMKVGFRSLVDGWSCEEFMSLVKKLYIRHRLVDW